MPWFADFKYTNLRDSCGQESKGLNEESLEDNGTVLEHAHLKIWLPLREYFFSFFHVSYAVRKTGLSIFLALGGAVSMEAHVGSRARRYLPLLFCPESSAFLVFATCEAVLAKLPANYWLDVQCLSLRISPG